MNQIKAYLEQYITLEEDDWNLFLSKLNLIETQKGALLIDVGKVENSLYFIESGILRFLIPKNEGDITFGFGYKGEFHSAYDSFITRKPCEYQIECLTNMTLWRISYDDLQKTYTNTKVGNIMGRIAAENHFLKKKNRELSLLTKSAEDRYQDLFIEQPEIFKQIPLKYIASYIGITPQALSRIRKRIID